MLDGDPTGQYVSEAVLAVRAYLKKEKLSIPRFCEEHGIDRLQMQRILNGEQRKVSVEFAKQVDEAIGGKLDWRKWAIMVPARRTGS